MLAKEGVTVSTSDPFGCAGGKLLHGIDFDHEGFPDSRGVLRELIGTFDREVERLE